MEEIVPAGYAVSTAPPPRRRRTVRTVGVVVAGLVVLGSVAGAAPDMLKTSGTEQLALPDSVTVVRLSNGGSGDVEVRPVEPGGHTRAVATSSWWGREPRPVLEVRGDEAVLESSCSNSGWAIVTKCSTEWEVVVPDGVEVLVDSSIGDVRVTGAGGRVEASAGLGDVRVEGSVPSLQVTTGIGDVDVELDAPPEGVRVQADLGDVTLRLPEADYDLDLKTDTGDPQVHLPDVAGAQRKVEVSTDLGEIRVDRAG